MLRLLRDMPTMADILAPMLERRFLSSRPTRLTAVSDWLPSVFSMLHMLPPMLVLLVMFIPPDVPVCLFFISDDKSLSVALMEGCRRTGGGREGRHGKGKERIEHRRKEGS